MIALDAQIALASGLPPMIESKLYQIEQPVEHDEFDTATNQSPRPKTVLGVFVGGRYAFYHHMSDFLRIVNNYHLTEASVDDILKITQEISNDMAKRIDEIAHIAQFSHEPWTAQPITPEELRGGQSSPVLASLAVSVLSMLTARPYAIMYGPLRQHGLLPYLKQKEPRYVSLGTPIKKSARALKRPQLHYALQDIPAPVPQTSTESRFPAVALVLARATSTLAQHPRSDHRARRLPRRSPGRRNPQTSRPWPFDVRTLGRQWHRLERGRPRRLSAPHRKRRGSLEAHSTGTERSLGAIGARFERAVLSGECGRDQFRDCAAPGP